MTRKHNSVILLFTALMIISCSRTGENSLINFDHLRKLTEPIVLDGMRCDIVHIYAEHPDYHWVDANDEGIACVDDVARAAVVYLRYYELTTDAVALSRAQNLLNFVLYMQADDGEFYNFINEDYTINRTGETSRKSFGHWAARGYWALGFGYRIFKGLDPDYANTLKNAFLKCKSPIEKLLQNYNSFVSFNGRRYPQWLIYNSASDATATLLLGITEYLKAEPEPQLSEYALKLTQGIRAMQVTDQSKFSGAFLSWRDLYHAWGNAQSQLFAALGKTLAKPELINAARNEADFYVNHLLVTGMINEWKYSDPTHVTEFPQIAYGIRCVVLGLLRLYDATDDENYAIRAGLAASWFFGNNAVQTVMYDRTTGRCFDGINDSTTVNLNSGAESTIEALLTMVEIDFNPIAKKYINYKKVRTETDSEQNETIYVFKNPDGAILKLTHDHALHTYRLTEIH